MNAFVFWSTWNERPVEVIVSAVNDYVKVEVRNENRISLVGFSVQVDDEAGIQAVLSEQFGAAA